MLGGLRPLQYYFIFSVQERLYTSEFDVYRRQILTYKYGPRIERFKYTFRSQ